MSFRRGRVKSKKGVPMARLKTNGLSEGEISADSNSSVGVAVSFHLVVFRVVDLFGVGSQMSVWFFAPPPLSRGWHLSYVGSWCCAVCSMLRLYQIDEYLLAPMSETVVKDACRCRRRRSCFSSCVLFGRRVSQRLFFVFLVVWRCTSYMMPCGSKGSTAAFCSV